MSHVFDGYAPLKGDVPERRSGVLWCGKPLYVASSVGSSRSCDVMVKSVLEYRRECRP